MKSIATLLGAGFALWLFFEWKESVIQYGWNEHDRCITETQRDMPPSEAIASCRSDEAFNRWRDGTGGSSSD